MPLEAGEGQRGLDVIWVLQEGLNDASDCLSNPTARALPSELPWNQIAVAACFLEVCPWHDVNALSVSLGALLLLTFPSEFQCPGTSAPPCLQCSEVSALLQGVGCGTGC